MREGYFLIYQDTDETHVNLITEAHYKRIVAQLGGSGGILEVAFSEEPIERWFTQTHCKEPWPYNDVKVLGTVCVPCC